MVRPASSTRAIGFLGADGFRVRCNLWRGLLGPFALIPLFVMSFLPLRVDAFTSRPNHPYLQEILAHLENHAYKPNPLSHECVRPSLEAEGADDIYTTCEKCVRTSTSGQLIFISPTAQHTPMLATARPTARILEGKVAYLYLPAPAIGTSSKAHYIRSVRKMIRRLCRYQLKGWIVDLRDTSGYDAESLLAAVNDLLKEGKLLVVESENDPSILICKQGDAILKNEHKLTDESGLLSRTVRSPETIAILQGRGTKGAGEAIIYALSQHRHTRRFGVDSGGDLIYRTSIPLSFGGFLLKSTGFYKSPDQSYRRTIHVDEMISETGSGQDHVLNAALEWVLYLDSADSSSQTEKTSDEMHDRLAHF